MKQVNEVGINSWIGQVTSPLVRSRPTGIEVFYLLNV